jgi:hypothetical protein
MVANSAHCIQLAEPTKEPRVAENPDGNENEAASRRESNRHRSKTKKRISENFIFLEYMQNGDLGQLISRLGQEEVPNRVLWSFWLCRELSDAHAYHDGKSLKADDLKWLGRVLGWSGHLADSTPIATLRRQGRQGSCTARRSSEEC